MSDSDCRDILIMFAGYISAKCPELHSKTAPEMLEYVYEFRRTVLQKTDEEPK